MSHLFFPLLFFLFPAALLAVPLPTHFHLVNAFESTLPFFYSTSASPQRHFATVARGASRNIPIPPANIRPNNFTIVILPILPPIRLLVVYDQSSQGVGTPTSATLSMQQLLFTFANGQTRASQFAASHANVAGNGATHGSTAPGATGPYANVATDFLFPSAAELVRENSDALPLLEEWHNLPISGVNAGSMLIVSPSLPHITEGLAAMREEIALQRSRRNLQLLGLTE